MKLITINGNGQGDYEVAVHRADCADVKKATRGHDFFEEEFDTKRELWLDYNADFITEDDEDAAWPIHFHPCTKELPDGGHYTKQ